MARYKLTNKSVDDLTEIWNFTLDNWSESQADIYYNMLLGNCQALASNPDAGRDYSAVIQNLLGFRAGRHIIFYRKTGNDEIEIARILHEQMDLKNRLKGK